jgi:hypothetical protein
MSDSDKGGTVEKTDARAGQSPSGAAQSGPFPGSVEASNIAAGLNADGTLPKGSR